MIDLTEGKITNGFYIIDETDYEKSEAIQSLDDDEIYVYSYDDELKRVVGQWRKKADFM